VRIRYFHTVLSCTSSSFLQMTVTTMMCLLVALQSVLLSSTSKANGKQFPLLFIVQHTSPPRQSKVAWEDCNKQEPRHPLQHVWNDSEGKSQTLCIHLKAVPLLMCAAAKIG
jgi:hypothetical protein